MLSVEEFFLSGRSSSSAEVRVVVIHDIKEVEGVRQQEVQEDKRDEEIGNEVNGEVEEVTQHTHETWKWKWILTEVSRLRSGAMTMERTRHKLEPQCVQSCKQGTVQQTRTTLTTKKRQSTKQTSSGHSRVLS